MKFNIILLFFISGLILISGIEYQNHNIQEGETIWSLSRKYGIAINELCRINQIQDITKIKKGSILKIPVQEKKLTTEPQQNPDFLIHILKKNETLWKLSKKYEISVKDICSFNEITNTKSLKSGMKIRIPLIYEYLEYDLPINGTLRLFNTSHFNGVYIFTENKQDKKNISVIDAGHVTYIDKMPGYGLTIFIRHQNGYVSAYSGFEQVYQKVGNDVKPKEIIGTAGIISRFNQYGILFSLQLNGKCLKFDLNKKKFIKPIL